MQYFNDEMGEAISASMAQKDTLLLGHNTFDEFAAYWPDKTGDDRRYPFAAFINDTQKVVVSTTLSAMSTGNPRPSCATSTPFGRSRCSSGRTSG